MNPNAKIYIAGHRGLAGSAIARELQRQGYNNIVTRTHAELDLEDAVATMKFFEQERPEIVFLAAAEVGGIHANNTYPVERLFADLRAEFGEKSGFSVQNLWYMRKFYREYKSLANLQPLAGEIAWTKNTLILDRCQNLTTARILPASHSPF